MKNNNTISNAELIKTFECDNPKTIREYASRIRKELLGSEKERREKVVSKDISIQLIEPIIYDKITKNPTNQDLKLAVEILKIKIANKGMDDKLDIDKYILKGKSCQSKVDVISGGGHQSCDEYPIKSFKASDTISTKSCQDEVDKSTDATDTFNGSLTHKELAKALEDNIDLMDNES